MTMLIKTYQYLLADIVERTGVHLDVPEDLTLSWVLTEAPMLDKKVLSFLENGLEQPIFPEWIKPLWDAFIVENDVCLLKELRQALVFCYKAEFEPSYEQREEALAGFLAVEDGIRAFDERFTTSREDVLFRSARTLVGLVIHKIDWFNITPSHGPGAVFPPRLPSCKSNFNVYYPKIAALYPYDQFFMGLPSFWWETLVEKDAQIEQQPRIVCNLAMVPKDSRGPRLISVHPTEAIWIQQGQRLALERAILNHQLTRGCINFHDQSVNGRIALESSSSREFVTLDLKEASDRLSCELIKYLFGGAYRFLDASRADDVMLPDGRVHALRKFAPMGNCLTFPVQSLVFWALIRASIRDHYGVNCNDVYVFGDDIIYPSRYHAVALNALIRAGLVPNMTKTFRLGSFRESCGVDAYRGFNITPHRMKVAGIKSYSDLISICDLAKRLRQRGYESCASFIYSQCRAILGVLHLSSNPEAQGIYEYVKDVRTVLLYEKDIRFNRSLQRWEVRILLEAASLDASFKHDWYHVQDSLLHIAKCDAYRERGTEYPIPYRERLTYGWTELSLC